MKAYELLTMIQPVTDRLSENGIHLSISKYLNLYHDYEKMHTDGYKKTYINAFICEKYGICRSQLHILIRRFNQEVR